MSEEFKLGYFEKQIRTELINFARCRTPTSYQKLCLTTNLQLDMKIEAHRQELAEILDDIQFMRYYRKDLLYQQL